MGEEEVVEVLEGEEGAGDLRDVESRPELPDLLHGPLIVVVGSGAAAAAGVGEEAAELVGANGGAAVGVRRERRPDVGRGLRLAPPELPREADATPVAPHPPSSPPPSPPPRVSFAGVFFLFFGRIIFDFWGMI